MPVDAQIQTMLDALEAVGGPQLQGLSPPEAREMFKLMRVDGEPEPVAAVSDRTIPGPAGDITVRVYDPDPDGDQAPVLVWFHGGGFVIGDLDTADGVARSLAGWAGVVVVSVDYRLAPENPWPAAPEDCWAAVWWVADHGAEELGVDPSRIAVGGDSAGGNLAAVVALRARDEGGPRLTHQLLVYPVTDCTASHPSITENGEGYFLTADAMDWFTNCYLGDGDRRDPTASPLFADDLSGVAPAQVITAEYDPLRDEGAAYAARLADAGVAVEHVNYPGMVHGFFSMGSVTPVAGEALAGAADRLSASFAEVAVP